MKPAEAIAAKVESYLFPYQLEWLRDRSKYKVGLWARQTGKSTVIALEAVLQALAKPGRAEVIISASQRQANEVLRRVTYWARVLDEALQYAGGEGVIASNAKTQVDFTNGSFVVSLPANPDTVRGFSGDVFWDEAARTAQADEIWKAILPIAGQPGHHLRITSTPFGDQGVFYDIWANKKGWARHKVTIEDAVKQGCPRDIRELRSQFDAMSFAQEYMCEFLSDAASYFPKELLVVATKGWEEQDLGGPFFVGVDIGRTHDRTAIVVLEGLGEDKNRVFHLRRLEVLNKASFTEQRRVIAGIIANERVVRTCIDSTGLGMQIAEDLAGEFGGRVEQVRFSGPVKEDLVTLTRRLMEEERLGLTDEPGLLADIHSIRRYVTKAGNVRFDAQRTSEGHADRFWALALALHAGNNQRSWNVDWGYDEKPAHTPVNISDILGELGIGP